MPSIPKILHYTFGMAKDFGGKPWSLVHHACLKSAVERIKPEKVFFYYEFEPSGPWWALSRSLITPIEIKAPREIFGKPLIHVAHRSDVVRLQKLLEHGGIYLDADVLVQRNFDDLLNESTVLGSEGEGAEFGMANAVILAEPNAPFLARWLDGYRSFRSKGMDKYWSEHSVKLPAKLAKDYPSEITVLPHKAFYWPLWTTEHLEWIYDSTKSIPLDCTYANHLWESFAAQHLKLLTPGQVRSKDTNFHSWVRPLIADLPDDYGAPSVQGRLMRFKDRALQRAHQRVRSIKTFAMRSFSAIGRRTSRFLLSENQFRQRVFQDVYRRGLWGHDGSSKFFSGIGSRGRATELYVEHMAEILRLRSQELGRPLTVVDIGCGDFRVGRALLDRLPGFDYVGCDIVPELIAHNLATYGSDRVTFRQVDVVCDPLPDGHVCLIRQVFQHLSNADILKATRRLLYPMVYVTEGHPIERTGPINPDKKVSAEVRFDWRIGRGRGVELDQAPYDLNTHEVFRFPNPPNEVLITEEIIGLACETPKHTT
jgi:SAM-dependent methyltransferase